ncbi:5001_t:CDS:2 [Rhizophagus irregularis]|nr:5001_t:CDS:2 [Rhizophagus irregularis]
MVRLESLCELRCDTSIDSSYFYGISRSCRYIQKLIIDNIDPKPNDGIVKLIETQKNLKYFEWKDNFENHYLTKDPYEEIFLALEKKANDLNFLKVHFQYVEGIDCTLFQNILSNIIENSGKHLKKIFFNPYDTIDCEFNDNFNGSSLNFIRKIYENCPLIEYLSIAFSPSKKHFDEFEKLLKICQNLKSILLVILDSNGGETNEKILENGEELLKVLTRSASINLKEIRFYDDFKFSLKSLENFFENWKNRPSLSILTNDLTYMEEDYVELINRYKNNGVIKDFDSNSDEICYHFYSTII